MANTPHKFKNGVDITGTAQVNSDTVVTETTSQTIQNKTIDNTNTIDVGALPTGIDAANIADGSVDNTEFQSLNGVTSNIQTQLDSKTNSADLASNANGQGASLVGIEDSGGIITATTVEGALAENRGVADSAQTDATQALTDAATAQTTIDNHIIDPVDAHDASAISYDNASSGLSATEVQAAIDEVKVIADSSSAGLIQKDPARVASTADIDLSTGGLLTIDTVTVSAGDRVLVKDQTDPTENGIYDAAVGSWTRSSDFDGTPSNEVQGGNLVYVNEGSVNIATSFRLQGNGELTVGVDALNFLIYSRAENIQAGDGLDKTGLTLSVDASDIAGAGLQEDGANNLELSPSSAGTGIQLNTGVYSLDFTEFDTDDMTEGSTNLYYTEGRFDTSFSGKDTDDLSEGVTNLYFTTERAQDATGAMATNSAKVSLTYDDGLNTLTPDIIAGSLVDADINASAGIDASKLADGSVSNTELQFINSLTSNAQTQLDGKLNLTGGTMTGSLVLAADPTLALEAATKQYVDSQTSAGANTALSNLITTSINQDLLPDSDEGRSLGSAALSWNELHITDIFVGQSNTAPASVRLYDSSSTLRATLRTNITTPSGTANVTGLENESSIGSDLGLITEGTSVGASGEIFIETGNGTGLASSGGITVRTGTVDSGTRGNVTIEAETVDLTGSTTLDVTGVTVVGLPTGSPGDIQETSFAAANNVAAPANVTGLAFANGVVRSFEAHVSVEIDATADLYEVFTLQGIQKGADWDMSVSATGDTSNVDFTITSAGQIQYTSGNEAGFVSSTIKFRAITTSV